VASAPDRTGPRAPRIRDVAERAGVGVGTVSRVLNDSPGVASATRERVRAVMDELGYRPSSTARNLSLGRTQTLGVIAPFFTSPSVVERLRGIDDVVGETAYDLALFNIETREQRRIALRRLAGHDRVDGLLIISLPPTGAEVRAFSRDGVPAVLVDVAHHVLPHVAIDDVAGGALAARHLLDAGHRDVAFIGDVKDEAFGFASSERRLQGFRATLRDAGVELAAPHVRRGPFGRETAGRLTRQLLGLRRRPTAIFAASDVQAFGVLDAAARVGLTVPEHLSVIGFDDIELAAAIGLTTVRQPLRESGRAGARLLLRALGDEVTAPAGPVALPELTVVARRTVAAAS
jgi:LacI family transcriptional regulator